jgi:hypothetical protein
MACAMTATVTGGWLNELLTAVLIDLPTRPVPPSTSMTATR